jgi:hypothetical protein
MIGVLVASSASPVGAQTQDEFYDEFEDPEATGWVLAETEQGRWSPSDEGGLVGSGSAFAVNETRSWGPARVEVAVADLIGTLNLSVRMSVADRTYVSLQVDDGLGVEIRQGWPGDRIGDRVVIEYDLPFLVTIEDGDDVVSVFVDDRLVVEARRQQPAEPGGIAFETVGGTEARITSIDVEGVVVGGPPDDERGDIPDVVGLPLVEALELLGALDLEVEWNLPETPAEDDVVIVHEQFDAPEDRFVRLVVGTFVPDLDGMSASDAADQIARHGLVLSTDGDEDGDVVGQEPEPDTWIGFGDSVAVTFDSEDGGSENGGSDGPNPWLFGGGGVVIVAVGWAIRKWIRRRHESSRVADRQPDREPVRDPDRRPPVVTTNLVLPLPRVDIKLYEGDHAGSATLIEAGSAGSQGDGS